MPVIKAVSTKTGATEYHRFIVTETEREDCPIKYTYSDLIGMDFCVRLIGTTSAAGIGSELWFETLVAEVTQRAAPSDWNIEVPATDDVSMKSGNYYSDNYTIIIAIKHHSCPVNLKTALGVMN